MKPSIVTVDFSPTNSQLFLSASDDNTVWLWGITGHQIGSPITGQHIAFSPDGTQFVSCNDKIVTIKNTDSRRTMVELSYPTMPNAIPISLLMEGVLLLFFGTLSTFGRSLVQILTSSRSLMDIKNTSSPLSFPPPIPSSQHPGIIQ
jgi:WD40 repeat protein